jgi:hypothetical protein
VTAKDSDGSIIEITNKREMEKRIIISNKKKFRQSFRTPFYNFPYNKLFGYKGLTPSAQKVLDGTFIPPDDASCHIKDFLNQLLMPECIKSNPNTMELTLSSFINFWRKAKENTSAYPSEFSFATTKASTYDIMLAIMDCTMTKIPLLTGYSPTRWQRCGDVMIQKKSNMTDVDSL